MVAPLQAQPAAPAQPVSPDQARPATPVAPDELTPNANPTTSGASMSAVTPVPSTNAAPAATSVPASISVIAESSLKAVLSELTQAWADNQDNSPQVPLAFTSSGIMAAKAATTGDYDVVISASIDDIKALTDKSVLRPEGQRMLARNLVVIYGRKALVKDDELDWFDLIGNEWKKVALGKPDTVASGHVAQHALQKHDLLGDDNKDLYTFAMTDGLAIGQVQAEKADAVFAYKTDVAKLNLNGFEIFPLDTADAPPVFYTAAVTRTAKNPALAHAFIDFLASDAAKPIWAKYGFETN
ncbi:MAG TPA: molybdate ABC transporter substrate-binding protein [Candidatus Methylacidiphilales bacterium]|nr:molybdate ABC transporter substrate-binding protein [Candidatus Methylacidiphilales bacterium]